MEIDVTFDFTTDTPRYWDDYWEGDPLMGRFNNDPDCASKTLRLYQKLLYSKPLPNGETMDLQMGSGAKYLTWKHFRFGSDSITASFRYKKYWDMIQKVADAMPNHHEYMERFVHQSYTIGGEIIFPKRRNSINQMRGCNPKIRDRWDLTLECIRRYYQNEQSPLYPYLDANRDFFDLFIDFRGYIDFFYLQDCVSSDYQRVDFWLGRGDFEDNPLPQTVEDYRAWIDRELAFVAKRNKRINAALNRKP